MTITKTYLAILKTLFTGTPRTSWETILENVMMDFESYCNDEVSDFISEKYAADSKEMQAEFENFCTFCIDDINEYDVI